MSMQNAWNWVNQKIGNFFGDFKEDRELREEPGVCRGITRLVCLVCLLGAFGYTFYRLYTDAPNVEVKRVYLQNKHTNFAIDRLFDRSASYGTDIDAANVTTSAGGGPQQEVLDCPCTNTTISWTSYVHFYIINFTSPDGPPIMDYGPHDGSKSLYLKSGPSHYNDSENSYQLFRDKVYLTTEKFCGNISLWPTSLSQGLLTECRAIVGGLLTTEPQIDGSSEMGGTNWNDPRASYFESPSLQSQKFLYSNTVRRLRAYVQGQYVLLISMKAENYRNATDRKMFLTGMAELLLFPLDLVGANSSTTDYYFFITAANTSQERFYERGNFWPDSFAVVLYEGQSFLGMDINWTDYYNECGPAYCDVTRKSTTFHRTYTVLAVVGGLWGLVVVVVTLLLWPLIAFLLVRFSVCCSRKVEESESTDEMLPVGSTKNFK